MSVSRVGVAFLSVLLATVASAFGQSTARLGNEFLINVYTSEEQFNPALASDADGDFVVTWRSHYQDGESGGVFGRRFNSTGVALGVEFMVNVVTLGVQGAPAVDRDADGDFVVVWQSLDGNSNGVFGRRFNSSGAALGGEFLANAFIIDSQSGQSVALDADGDFVVAWSSYLQDGDYGGIFARQFTASGSPGAEFRVNTFTVEQQGFPAVARDQDGDFVVVWQSYSQDGDSTGVFGRRFNALGTAQAVEFQVNTTTIGYQAGPQVDMESDGDFVVVWYGTAASAYDVYFQRFSSSGARLGGQVQVTATFTEGEFDPAVGVNDAGQFVVTWGVGEGQDGSENAVFARHFDAFGTPLGKQFQVNSYTPGPQAEGRVALATSGKFVAAWSSPRGATGVREIFAQRYRMLANLDIDGNGTVMPLSDAILVLRYTFGFRGATLITGAVGAGCTRCTAPEIEAHIASQL